MKDQPSIERLGHTFDDSFLVIGRSFKWNNFVGTSASNELIHSYGCVINFAQFRFYSYGTPCPLASIGMKFSPREFSCASKVFPLLASTLASLDIIKVLLDLHPPNIDSPCSDFLLDFQPNSNFKIFVDSFKSIFLYVTHLLAGGPFGMVFEHFRYSFDLENSMSGFIQLHQLCSHVATIRISRSMVRVLRANWHWALAKPSNIYLI